MLPENVANKIAAGEGILGGRSFSSDITGCEGEGALAPEDKWVG